MNTKQSLPFADEYGALLDAPEPTRWQKCLGTCLYVLGRINKLLAKTFPFYERRARKKAERKHAQLLAELERARPVD